MSNVTFESIAQDRVECELALTRAAEFEKLMKNKEFKKLILEGYCKDELLRLTALMAVVSTEQKERVVAEIEAIARFQQFVQMPIRVATQAKEHLEYLEEAEAELHATNEVAMLTSYEG